MDYLRLTHLERIGPKGWLRYVFPFQLPDDYDIDVVASVLRAGFDSAKRRLLVMDCEAVPDMDAQQAGVLKLQQIPEGDIEAVSIEDLRAEGAFPMTFSELKSKGFPVASFEATKVCRRSVWPAPGDRLPISLVQLNFIQGGMILAWNLFHMFGDGVTFFVWAQVWAEECRRAQGLAIPDPVDLPDKMLSDRAQLMEASGRNTGNRENHPEYLILPCRSRSTLLHRILFESETRLTRHVNATVTPQGAPPKMASNTHRGQVFYFSPKALVALKADASPIHATQLGKEAPEWISTNDAVSALLWRTVMAVQNPIESLGDADPISAFAMAIDGRSRTDPPVHPRTLGCFLEYVAVEMPIRKMLKCKLADIAVEIRKSVARADKNWTDDVVTLVDRLEDVDRIVAKAFTDVPGYNCVQSSVSRLFFLFATYPPLLLYVWSLEGRYFRLGACYIFSVLLTYSKWTNFRVFDLSWGELLGNKILAMRCPDVGVINGLQIPFPSPPEGGLEVLIGVEENCLDRLLHEPLWAKYASLK